MTEQTLQYIIIALVGIIIGGTGGAALIRKVTNAALPNSDSQSSASAASAAAAAAVSASATLLSHIKALEDQLASNTQRLMEMEQTFNRFLGACPERHTAIERRLEILERVGAK